MTRPTNFRFFVPLLLLPACIIDAPSSGEPPAEDCEGKCDAPADQCYDAAYGDGSCDLDLPCAAPDIDCFVTFDSDAEAAEWFTDIEAEIAQDELREPRNLLSASDPRYPRIRELLDRGWQSYTEQIPVDDLAERRVALVIVEDPAVNAFVVPDLDLERSGLAVMVHTGTLDAGGTDDELLGLVMHELEHAVGLHTLPGRKEAFSRGYQVLPGEPEPFGFEQPSDPVAEEALGTVIAAGREVGLRPHPELNGLPLHPGLLFTTVTLAHAAGVSTNPSGCEDAQAALELLREFVIDRTRALDGALVLGEDAESLDYVASEYVMALRDQCLAGSSPTLFEILETQLRVPADQIQASLPPEDLALVDGKHVVEAIRALAFDRYERLRAVDDALGAETGGGIESLRYFSTEEAADDRTVGVLRRAGSKPDGLADFFLNLALPPEQRAECLAVIESGEVPPYGVDLTDDHHATCWRIWHLRALAERDARGESPAAVRVVRRPELERRLRDLRVEPLPRSERFSDYIPDCSPGR